MLPTTDPSPTEGAAALGCLHRFAFRDLVAGFPGWAPLSAEPLAVEVEGRTSRLHPLARSAWGTVLQHRSPPGEPVPDYAIRYAIREASARTVTNPAVVFSDLLQATQVWQWREPVSGTVGICREHHPRSTGSATPLLDWIARGANRAATANALQPDAEMAVLLLPALLRRVRRRRPAPFRDGGEVEGQLRGSGDLLQVALETVERTADPALLRAFWRGLEEFAVLDPDCDTAEGLLAALAVLRLLKDACLERMAAWVADLDRSRPPPRPEKLGDFRALLTCADDARRYAGRPHFIVESVLSANLHGICATPEALDACRRGLGRMLEQVGGAWSEAIVEDEWNLRPGRPGCGIASRRELLGLLAGQPDDEARVQFLEEEVDTIARARRLCRRMRRAADGDAGPAVADTGEAAFRLSRLRAELDGYLARAQGIDPADRESLDRWRAASRPCHIWLEFYAVASRGGFDVTLGSGARAKPASSRVAGPLSDAGGVDLRVRERRSTFGDAPPEEPGGVSLPIDPDACVPLRRGEAAYPRQLADLLGGLAPEVLTLRGDPGLLGHRYLALFCSVQAPEALVLSTFDLARRLRDAGVPLIGGFQSPVERNCLDFLLRGRQPVAVSPAREVETLRLPAAWRTGLGEGRLLLVSRFDERHHRPTARLAEARNLLVAALAERTFIAHATPGGRTYRLARQLIEAGRPVHAFDHAANADLLLLGALPVALSPDREGPGSWRELV